MNDGVVTEKTTLKRAMNAKRLCMVVGHCDECVLDAEYGDNCIAVVINTLGDAVERMMNCTNCGHKGVCAAVAERRANRANDYSPCSHWTLEE